MPFILRPRPLHVLEQEAHDDVLKRENSFNQWASNRFRDWGPLEVIITVTGDQGWQTECNENLHFYSFTVLCSTCTSVHRMRIIDDSSPRHYYLLNYYLGLGVLVKFLAPNYISGLGLINDHGLTLFLEQKATLTPLTDLRDRFSQLKNPFKEVKQLTFFLRIMPLIRFIADIMYIILFRMYVLYFFSNLDYLHIHHIFLRISLEVCPSDHPSVNDVLRNQTESSEEPEGDR